jgi:hypothetical protein
MLDLHPSTTGYLHDTRDALRNCCLIFKSWIPRTRKHLFADVRFYTMRPVITEGDASGSFNRSYALRQTFYLLAAPTCCGRQSGTWFPS